MSRCTFALWWLSAGLAVGCHRETSKGLTAPNPSTDATPALVVSAPPPAETSAQGLDESEKACKLLAAKPLPSSDAPGAADLPSLAGCDAALTHEEPSQVVWAAPSSPDEAKSVIPFCVRRVR